MPRILVLTTKAVYIVVQNVVNNSLVISSERTIPIGAVRYISTSTLRDDWFALGVSSPQEPDPLLNCVFKTEFFLQFKTVAVGGFNLRIGDSIEYNKKPGKPAVVKVMKDPAIPRDDMYKSGTIHVGQGESPSSVSRPTPRGKAIAKPITSGKLLRPGGPGGGPSKVASRPRPAAAATPRPVPIPAAAVNRPVAQINGTGAHARNESASSFSSNRLPPPPPPPAAPLARISDKPQAKVKYDFNSPNSNELDISAGDVLDILRKEGNGKHDPAILATSN